MISIDFKQLKNTFDTEDIFSEISSFGMQISDALSAVDSYYDNHISSFEIIQNEKIESVLICGMGGSAVGGDVARIILSKYIKVPVIVHRSSNIPNWINKQTLVIVSSYSGDTSETIKSYEQAVKRTNKIIAISSGGILKKYCDERHHIRLDMPLGFQPRCALGYSSSIIASILMKLNLVNDDSRNIIKHEFELTSELLQSDQLECLKNIESPFDNPAIVLALKLQNKIPIIYGSEEFSSIIALRFKNQLQENSKVMSFSNNYPEINHNEIQGWSSDDKYFAIWLSDEKGNSSDFNSAQKLLNQLKIDQLSIDLKNYLIPIDYRLGVLYALIYFFDWVSYYLALLQEENPCSIDNIKYIKNNSPTSL